MRKLILILFMLPALAACDFYDHRLKVINKTGSSICVETFDDAIPDLERMNHTDYYMERSISSNTSSTLMEIGKNGWPESIDNSRNKKLNLFVFKIDSLKKHGSMEHLIDHQMYTLYTFSKEDLERANWEVIVTN